MDNVKFCQSCGMPLGEHLEECALEKDGSKSVDYCKYCYENGVFTQLCTMDEMIAFCLPFQKEAFPDLSEDALLTQMQTYFATLKRWQKESVK